METLRIKYEELQALIDALRSGEVDRLVGDSDMLISRLEDAKEAVLESQAFAHDLVHSLSDGIAIIDLDGKIIDVNPAYCGLIGYSRDELVGCYPPYPHWPKGETSTLHSEIQMALSGDAKDFEAEFEHKDGHTFPVLISPSLIKDHKGNILNVAGVIKDISEQKRAQKAILESETRLRELVDHMRSGVAVYRAIDGGEDFEIVDFNRAAERIARLKKDELLGKTLIEMFPSARESGILEALQKVHESGKPEHLEEIFYRDARLGLWVDLFMYKVPSGELVNIFNDVSDRVEAREERNKLAAAIENAFDAIVITDENGVAEYVNRSHERLTGFSREEILGKEAPFMDAAEEDPDYQRNLWNTIRRGKVWKDSFLNHKKDGTPYRCELVIYGIQDETGYIANFVSIERDISEEVNLQQQLHQARKMEALGQLSGGVAHDFNNILQAILGYGQIAIGCTTESLEENPCETCEGNVEFLNEMLVGADRAATLIRQLLAFSRKQVLHPKIVDLNKSIHNIMKMLDRLITENIDLIFIPKDNIANVKADPSQIDQILINLCVNARDAMPQGGDLVIRTDMATFDEAYCKARPYARPGRFVMFSVADTGVGIDEETRAHIFEPFFSTKEMGKGTGLGLATVYGIVKQHEGFIHVYSEIDKGTTFRIYLPLAVEREMEEMVEEENEFEGGTETILLAEDDEPIRTLAERVLQMAGYKVISASNGEEALRLFEQHKDEIAMLAFDAIMPKVGGLEACAEIRAEFPDIPILVSSGYSAEAITSELLHLEHVAFMQKPYSPKDMLRKIRQLLDRRN